MKICYYHFELGVSVRHETRSDKETVHPLRHPRVDVESRKAFHGDERLRENRLLRKCWGMEFTWEINGDLNICLVRLGVINGNKSIRESHLVK